MGKHSNTTNMRQAMSCLFSHGLVAIPTARLAKLTTAILLTSSLQGMITIPAQAQDTTNQLRQVQRNFTNQASYTYSFTDPDNKKTQTIEDQRSEINKLNDGLVDPLGRILGCDGNLLSDYTGWSVALYEPAGATGTEFGSLVNLTRTEVPDIANNNISQGLNPNTTNDNPFTNIPNTGQYAGGYNFLFDTQKGQTNVGKSYILAVRPPTNNTQYPLRRILIKIEESFKSGVDTVVRYTATALDGIPISLTGEKQLTGVQVFVSNAAQQGLDLLAFQLSTNMCASNQARINKTGDRATAAPGDTVIYRVSVTNNADIGLTAVSVNDILPVGFRFLSNSVRGEIGGQAASIITNANGNSINFFAQGVTMNPGQTLNIVYAVQLTNDAQRGTGRNTAVVQAQRNDNNRLIVRDGPAIHSLKVVQGIVSDSGTIVGRVFVDKNFDGEQQNDEPGVPNAVIYLQDGNRITTDANGLFSVSNVLPGYHTGVLDLTSLPGYTLAPNRKFNERNSQSRLVHLAPGGLVRMNFAVTPSFKEQPQK